MGSIPEGTVVRLFHELGEQLGEQLRHGQRDVVTAVSGLLARTGSSATNKSHMSEVHFKNTQVSPTEAAYPVPTTAEDDPAEVQKIVDLLKNARSVHKGDSEKDDRENSIDWFFADVVGLYDLSCRSGNGQDNKLKLSDLYDGATTTGSCDLLISPEQSPRPILGAI